MPCLLYIVSDRLDQRDPQVDRKLGRGRIVIDEETNISFLNVILNNGLCAPGVLC